MVLVRFAPSRFAPDNTTETKLLPDKSHFSRYAPSKSEYLKFDFINVAELNITFRLTIFVKSASSKLHP